MSDILPKILWGADFSIKETEGAELYGGLDIVSDLCFEKNRSDTYTAKGAAKTGIEIVMLENCIGSRFPDAKVQKMRNELRALGAVYVS